jgi:hypothetical protein
MRLLVGALVLIGLTGSLLLTVLRQGTSQGSSRAHLTATPTAQRVPPGQQEQQQQQAQQDATRAQLALHVQGTRLVTRDGAPVVLRGVNRDGTDFDCAEGKGIFDGPTGPHSILALEGWHINAVRLPLNEACWLGLPGVPLPYSGANYRAAIESYVQALTGNGLYVIVDLHKNAPGTEIDTHSFQRMPDADHAPAFWTSVASDFGTNGMVLFDLFNEPHDITWPCWRDGGAACTGVPFKAAGMQQLVSVVRATGATNVVVLAGVSWASDLSGWLAHMPQDPLHNLTAAVHVYTQDFACRGVACYASRFAPVAAHVPLVVGEFGTDVHDGYCGLGGVDILLEWLDRHTVSYLAWTWNVGTQSCGSQSLISDWNGTPMAPNGTYYRSHLLTIPLGHEHL